MASSFSTIDHFPTLYFAGKKKPKLSKFFSLTLSYIMLYNGQTYFKNLAAFRHTLKYVWLFYNIMQERAKS